MTGQHPGLSAQIMTVLEGIPEPCSIAMGGKTSLAGMGLVDDIAVSKAGQVTITLCLTDAACVHFTSMQKFIADAVGALSGVTSVRVVQTLDKLWTPDRVRS